MPDEDPLDGLDAVAWSELTDARGSAEAIPELLCALESGDAESAASAESELADRLRGRYGHRIYEVTSYAVPFLARLAAAGVRTESLLTLLGDIAEGARWDQLGARDAIADEVALLASLMDHPHADVRHAAIRALVCCERPALVLPALIERWSRETDADTRYQLLGSLVTTDAATAAVFAKPLLGADTEPPLRLAAFRACATAGVPWDTAMSDAATAWMQVPLESWTRPWTKDLYLLAQFVEGACGVGAAIHLTLRGFDASGPAARRVHECAAWWARHLAGEYRDLEPHFTAPLLRLMTDGDTQLGASAVRALHMVSPIGRQRDDATRAIADVVFAVACAVGPAIGGVSAPHAWLLERGDPRVQGLLAESVRQGHGDRVIQDAMVEGVTPDFDPALFEAIRERLAARPPEVLLKLLGEWGPQAAAAAPETAAVLHRELESWRGEEPPPYKQWVAAAACDALAAMGAALPECIAVLRETARGPEQDGATNTRLGAAVALHTLTGEEEPLLLAVEVGLRGNAYVRAYAARCACELEPSPDRLGPALSRALAVQAAEDVRGPVLRSLSALGRALLHHCGVTASREVADTLAAELVRQEDLSSATSDFSHAAALAARLGSAAAPVIPCLVALLDHDIYRPAATRALLRVDPDRFADPAARSRLADALVRSVQVGSWERVTAAHVLLELGPEFLSPAGVAILREAAEGPKRFVFMRPDRKNVRRDERIRSAVREVLGRVDALAASA